jgi:hypothetical protein
MEDRRVNEMNESEVILKNEKRINMKDASRYA